MLIKQKIRKLQKYLARLPLSGVLLSGALLLSVIAYGLIFGLPKSASYTYSGQDCVGQLTLFPQSMHQTGQPDFLIEYKSVIRVGSHPIASLKTCFTANEQPHIGTTRLGVSPFGGWFAHKTFALNIENPPQAQVTDFVGRTLPVTRPIEIALSAADEVFDYSLLIDDKMAACRHEQSKLYCDVVPLDLNQGQDYHTTLVRNFHGTKVEELGGGDITTLRALVLAEASVDDGQTVYEKPTGFSFEYDKILSMVDAQLQQRNGETLEVVPSTVSFEGKKASITPTGELKRNAQYVLSLKAVEAEDGSALPDPHTVNFTLSGGPKVIGINVNKTGVAVGGTIIISFDQEIANADSIAKLVTIQGLSAQIVKKGNQLLVSYSGAVCTDFVITVKKGFESVHGVVQQDDWSFSGRTLCYTTHTIGYSHQGRAIIAYSFGSGGKTILYTGGIHGNEHSARLLMNAWINELDANARSIPAGTRIVVIPSINPDGAAANSRYNAAGVDLNRNYDTSDWKQDVETVNGSPLPGGGGAMPASEPETQALVAYTQQLQPALTMSYHSSASYAIANTCGNSAALADAYAELTGYQNMTGVSGAFSYQITGTYDDWICERLGRASVLIELATSTNSEFSRNKAALWAMAQ